MKLFKKAFVNLLLFLLSKLNKEMILNSEELPNHFIIGFRRKIDPTKIRKFELNTELEFNYNQMAYLVKQEIPDALPILIRVK